MGMKYIARKNLVYSC